MTGTGQPSSTVFDKLDQLLGTSAIIIDRPAGTAHPRYPNVVYPVDYGYLDGTTSGDGEGIDVFVGTAAGRGILALAITVDVLARDTETKLLIDCDPDETSKVEDLLANTLHLGVHLVHRATNEPTAPTKTGQLDTPAAAGNGTAHEAKSDPRAQPRISEQYSG